MTPLSRATFVALGMSASFAWSSSALAQDTVIVEQPQAQPPAQTTVVQPAPSAVTMPPGQETEMVTEKGGPSRGMLASGLVLFGVTYGSSLVVGVSSDQDYDEHLVVPFAGPWMDLADRGSCDDSDRSCDWETTYKVMLVGDGILQAVGGVLVVGAFLNPEERTVTRTTEAPKLKVAPVVGHNSYGLMAAGTF